MFVHSLFWSFFHRFDALLKILFLFTSFNVLCCSLFKLSHSFRVRSVFDPSSNQKRVNLVELWKNIAPKFNMRTSSSKHQLDCTYFGEKITTWIEAPQIACNENKNSTQNPNHRRVDSVELQKNGSPQVYYEDKLI